jgi:hypothetical protein
LERAETALFDWRIRELQVSQLADQVRSNEGIFLEPLIADKPAHTEATEALAQAKHERGPGRGPPRDVRLTPTPKRATP